MQRPPIAAPASLRIGPITAILLALGVVTGLGLVALIAHSVQVANQTPIHPGSAGAQAILGVVVDGSLRVVSVDSGGGAARAGIRIDDVLEAAGGTTLPSAPTARQTVRSVLAAQKGIRRIVVTLIRDGRVLRLSVAIGAATGAIAPQVTPTPAYGNLWYL